jgi:uncharacterized protein YecE (DUF72 family)
MSQSPWPLVGTVGFDGAQSRTFRTLGCVELTDGFSGMPKPTQLRRLRSAAGPGFEFVVRASCALSHPASDPLCRRVRLPYLKEHAHPHQTLEASEASELAWGFTLALARSLQALHVFLQTPTSFRSTSANEDRLARFVSGHVSGSGLHLVWDALADWPRSTYLSVCSELGLIPTFDPLLEEEPPPTEQSYLRVLGRARTGHGLSNDDLRTVAEAATAVPRAMVAFHTPTSFRDARELNTLLGESAP